MALYNEKLQERIVKTWQGPKGICECGHLGDGRWSQHRGHPKMLENGHGECAEPGCKCKQFTWVRWSGAFADALREAQYPGR